MTDKITIKPQGDHVLHWVQLKQMYKAKRGSFAGKFGLAVPYATNGDVALLVKWWDNELRRELMRNLFANDQSPSSVKQWYEHKAKIDKHIAGADKTAVYPENDWFWDEATKRLAIYLQSRKAIPSRSELMIDAIGETVVEHGQAVKELAKDAASTVTDAGKEFVSTLKKGALILGGIVGAAVVLPPVIRAFRDDRRD